MSRKRAKKNCYHKKKEFSQSEYSDYEGRGGSLMKQMIQIIRKADVEKEYIHTLKLELDYELATLYDAMQQNDSSQKDKSKKRLAEIQVELEALHAL